jgi:hypothetical protein
MRFPKYQCLKNLRRPLRTGFKPVLLTRCKEGIGGKVLKILF